MNSDVRNDYANISGFDPIIFFETTSPHYYLNNSKAWIDFLEYRTKLVTKLHKTFLDYIFQNSKTLERDVILTAVDSQNYNYPDVEYKTFTNTGVDLPAILQFMNIHDFQLQVEDPWQFWSSNPFRYVDFKRTYLTQFPHLAADEYSIMFDLNIVKEAHISSNGQPAFHFPSNIQTGIEFALTIGSLFSSNSRLALFSEHSVEPPDFSRLKWALAGDTTISKDTSGTVTFSTKRTTKLEGNGLFYSVSLNGKGWPAWSSADGSVLLPVGSHKLNFDVEGAYTGIRLVGISCSLEDAVIVPGGIAIDYNSPRQKAVLTVEAFAKQDNEPFQVLVDGQLYNAKIYPFYGHYHLFLPKGKHTVQIRVVHELTAGSGQPNGATDVSINKPVVITFSNPIDPATLTPATIILKEGNTPVAGSVSYDAATMSAVFRPDQALNLSTHYTLSATTGVTDIYGKKLPAAANLAFTTDSYGDINSNKKVDISAALKYLRVAQGLDPQPGINLAQIIIAPVNRATGKPQPQPGRTRVNLQDALAALERSVGLW